MKNKKIFTVDDATITIDSETKLQFNHNKCYKIDLPYVFTTGYRCKGYVLLHELQGFLTDEIIEPKTSDEFQEELHTKNNPFYLDIYDSLHDSLSIKNDTLQGYDLCKRLDTYENDWLEYFHLFKVDDISWNEIDLNLEKLKKKDLIEWNYFAN